MLAFREARPLSDTVGSLFVTVIVVLWFMHGHLCESREQPGAMAVGKEVKGFHQRGLHFRCAKQVTYLLLEEAIAYAVLFLQDRVQAHYKCCHICSL